MKTKSKPLFFVGFWIKCVISTAIPLSFSACGTIATEIGESVNSVINAQDKLIDEPREKIIYKKID